MSGGWYLIKKNRVLSPWKLKLKIEVKDGRRRRSASAHGHFTSTSHAVLYFPRKTRKYIMVLHEMAHVLTPHKYAGHGEEYCTNYLYLIKHFLGEAAYEEMVLLFNENKIKFDYGTYLK
jgi:putative metallohydrolase (TIGR04338 family)